MIGACPNERGEERVVDVDDMMRISLDHLIADDLHVSCQDDKGDLLFPEKFHFGLFYFLLVGMVFLYGPHIVRDLELVGDISQVLMVADDAGNVDIPFPRLVPGQEIVKAMAHLAHENGHARTLITEIKVASHLVSLCVKRVDVFIDLVARDEEILQFPFDPHEKHPVFPIYVLVQINDISLVVRNKLRDFRNDAWPIGTMQK